MQRILDFTRTFRSWISNAFHWLYGLTRWFSPGLGVKRWILVILAGTTLLGVGVAVLILDIYRNAPETWWLPIISWLSLRFLWRPLRVLIFGALGVGLVLYGVWGLNNALMAPFGRQNRNILDAMTTHRKKERGPKVVAIGGGHGLAAVLRGIKAYTHNITAVVTVADDGGSSGRLRQSMGILPPGDIRNCLAALSSDEELLTQLFQYRFSDKVEGLQGHSFGNLFISALAEITGSFETAVAESGRVLSVNGRVLPATLHDVRLAADVMLPHQQSDVRIQGESRIPTVAGKVRHLWLEPADPPAYPKVIQAILQADMIIIGPGSLYTSILPNLLVPEITRAILASRGLRIFVCNIANQPGETDGYKLRDYLQAIESHIGARLFDLVLCNRPLDGAIEVGDTLVDCESGAGVSYPVYQSALVDKTNPRRHDPVKMANVLMDLWAEKTGPLGDGNGL